VVVGQLEQVTESQVLDEAGQLQTSSAVTSVAKTQKQPDILKIQQSHLFGVNISAA